MPHRPRSIHLLNLPDELLIEIVQRLNIRELLIAGQVCSQLRWISKERRLWRFFVEELYWFRHIRPPPHPTLLDLCREKLERLSRVPIRLQRAWSGSRPSREPHLISNFTFDLPSGAFAEVQDSRSTWSLIPGGKQILHVYCGPLPDLHVRLLDTQDRGAGLGVNLCLTLAQSQHGGGWFGDICVQPNGQGTGVFIAYLYADNEFSEHYAFHVYELLFESDGTPPNFTPINQLTCYARPHAVHLEGHIAVLAFVNERGAFYFFVWDALHNAGAFIDTSFKTTSDILLRLVNGNLIIASIVNHAVVVYNVPRLVPHASLPRKPSFPVSPKHACRLDRDVALDSTLFMTSDMWSAKDYTEATLLFSALDVLRTNLVQCWIDNTTGKVVLSCHRLPESLGRCRISSSHVGSTHNVTTIAWKSGVLAYHLPNPRRLRDFKTKLPGLEFPLQEGPPVTILDDKMFSNSPGKAPMFDSWNGGEDLQVSFDEVTGQVAFGNLFDSSSVWLVDYAS